MKVIFDEDKFVKNPLLSVCIITYNHEKYVAEAIEGVLMQKTEFPFEIIIAEDFSTDNTRNIVRNYQQKYPHLIKLLLQEKNVGAAQNWMDLITHPKAKYIAYFEADDYWIDSHKVQKQVDFLEQNKEYSMTFHSVEILNETNKPYSYPTPKKESLTLIDLLLKHYIPTQSLLFRRESLPKKFPDWFILSKIGDIPLELMLADKGLTKYIPEKMGIYRRHTTSITHTKEQKAIGRKAYLFIFTNLNIYFNYRYWYAFAFMIIKIRLGYIKDFLGLNYILK